jgi:flagellar biosynthesis protein FlhB
MENQADKSQEATPYKLAEARKKGQVGKSLEFVSIVSLISMLATFIIVLPGLAEVLAADTRLWLLNTNQFVQSTAMMGGFLKHFLGDILGTLGIVLFVGAMTAIISSLVHAGPVFSFFPLKFDFSKLNPANGLKKIFSRKSLFEITKLILKLAFFAGAFVFIWNQLKGRLLFSHNLTINNLLIEWKSALTLVVVTFLAIFIIFAVLDLWYSKRDFAKQMRMSTRDIKDEYKRREGDPEIKHKRKKGMQQLMRNVMGLSQMKNADVIVTNPTHVAVALQYRPDSMALPKVLVKGKGFLAQIIMRRATKLSIPIVRVPILARALYKECEINNPIPLDQQLNVAKIYRELIKMPGSKVFSNA